MDILKVKQNGEWVGIPAIKGDKGEKGDTGEQGQKGADGFSPTASVSKSGSTATITITDKNGTTSATVSDGAALIDDTAGTGDTDKAWSADKTASELGNVFGALNSVEESIAPVETTATATATHAVGELFMLGDSLLVALSAIAVGDTITTTGATPNAAVTSLSAKMIKDVQVNGVSVLNQGVANVPMASSSDFGVVKVDQNKGLFVNDSILQIYPAGQATIKGAGSTRNPVVPYYQHESTFYGLAKAAGADMASSSNPVGTYTDAAKVAIQKMLGIYEAPWELIREDTFTNETSADHVVNTDANGQSFELVEAIILFETPVQDTESSIGASGGLKFGYTAPASGSTNYATKIEIGSWTQAANASAHGGAGVFKQDNGLVQIYRAASTTPSNTGNIGLRYGAGFPNLGASDRIGFAIISETWYVNLITIMTVTGTGHYKLFGRRKWN